MERQHLPSLQFGMTINAAADSIPRDIALAQQVEHMGFDFLSVSDHPYNPGMVDSWTWLAYGYDQLLTSAGGRVSVARLYGGDHSRGSGSA